MIALDDISSVNNAHYPKARVSLVAFQRNLEMETDKLANDLGEQSAYEDADEMKRRLRRGDETKGDPDDRDIAGDYADSAKRADVARDQGLGRRDVPS